MPDATQFAHKCAVENFDLRDISSLQLLFRVVVNLVSWYRRHASEPLPQRVVPYRDHIGISEAHTTRRRRDQTLDLHDLSGDELASTHFACRVRSNVPGVERIAGIKAVSSLPGRVKGPLGYHDNGVNIAQIIGRARGEGSDQDQSVKRRISLDTVGKLNQDRPLTSGFRCSTSRPRLHGRASFINIVGFRQPLLGRHRATRYAPLRTQPQRARGAARGRDAVVAGIST